MRGLANLLGAGRHEGLRPSPPEPWISCFEGSERWPRLEKTYEGKPGKRQAPLKTEFPEPAVLISAETEGSIPSLQERIILRISKLGRGTGNAVLISRRAKIR